MDGVCKLCGAERKFQQKTEEHVWEEERNADAASARCRVYGQRPQQ